MRLDGQFLHMALPDLEIINHVTLATIDCSIDTRTLKSGQFFVALEGKQVDGHAFLLHALQAGAAGILINESKKDFLLPLASHSLYKNVFIATVKDTFASLIRLAKVWRQQFSIPIVGITGSMGKTSTKEALSHILTNANVPHIASYANQNTLLGAALNVLRISSKHAVALFEMGISQRGEMAQLADLVRPTTAIITTIGHCHMEGLGSLHDIATEKRDIFKYFTEKSIGIINGDCQLLSQVSYIHPVIKFGTKTINQIQARKINIQHGASTFVLKLYKDKYQVTVAKAHEGAVYNALAAAAAAYMLGIKTEYILKGIQESIVVEGRFQEKRMHQFAGSVIDDCYNANPESMKAALLAFEKYSTSGQKIAILGDMLELGVNGPFWHRQLGRFLRKVPSLKKVILVGEMVKWTRKTAPVSIAIEQAADWREALTKVEPHLAVESVVLLKGSLGMKLSGIVEALCGPKKNTLTKSGAPSMTATPS